MGPYAPDPQGAGGRGIDACLEHELLQPSWLYLVEQVALSGQGVDWPEGMSERWLGGLGGVPILLQTDATLQLLQLDSPLVAVVLCFGEGRGGRAWRRGKSPQNRATPQPSILLF